MWWKIFKQWCGLPNVNGVINGTHILILKPQTFFLEDYYYHKISDYSIIPQIVIDCNKKFLDYCIGMSSRVNDSKVLRKFTLYWQVQFHGLFDINKGVNGFPPYLLSDKTYPLIYWIMTCFKKEGQYWILELFYNRKHILGGRLIISRIFLVFWKRILRNCKSLIYMYNIPTWCMYLLLFVE